MFGRKMMAKAAQQKPKKEKKGITGPYSEKLGPEGYGGEVRKQKVRKQKVRKSIKNWMGVALKKVKAK